MAVNDPLKALREAVEDAPQIARDAIVGTLDGEPLRAEFPLRTTVFGVDAVVIPAAEYERLTTRAEWRSRFRGPEKAPAPAPKASTVERDPEVAAFLRERFTRAGTLAAVHADCLERFGAERTPSQSRIARFRSKRWRRA